MVLDMDSIGDRNAVFCEECGEPIPPRRLEVMPFAKHCIGCQEANENNSASNNVVFPLVPLQLSGPCPRCKKGIAVVYQNSTYKNFFVGCSTFPRCKWAVDIDE